MNCRVVAGFRVCALFIVILFAGCGGGSGSSSPPPPANGLSVDKEALSFNAEQGASLPAQTIVGTIRGATAPVIVNIAYTTVGIDYATYTQLSATSGQLVVTPLSSARAPGTYIDSITVTACYDAGCTQPLPGSPKVISVTSSIQAPMPSAKLLLSERGVAFASVPTQSSLTRSLTVTDSSSSATTWTATSDQAWLTATASGVSGGTMTLTASPTGLADGFHQANVAVVSSNSALASQNVRVGFYVSSTASASSFSSPPVLFSTKYWLPPSNWVVDPIRPVTYTATGSSIAIDHAYTGARVGSINVAGASYQSIAIGDDGSRLYALNITSSKIDVIDLDLQTVVSSLSIPPSSPLVPVQFDQLRMLHMRVHGIPVLILNSMYIANRISMPILDAVTGQQLGTTGLGMSTDNDVFVGSRDGRVLYYSNAGLSGILGISRVNLNANASGNIYGVLAGTSAGNNVAGLQDIATNADGSRVYAAWYTDSFVRTFTYVNGIFSEAAQVTLLGAGNYGANIETDPLGQVVIGVSPDLRVYLPNDTLSYDWPGMTSPSVIDGGVGSLRVTSDGLRALGNGKMFNIK